MSYSLNKQTRPKHLLPYTFAKTYKVIAIPTIEEQVKIYHEQALALETLMEIKRLITQPLYFEQVNANQFQQHLSHYYQTESSVDDVAQTMHHELDLSLLAEQLPTGEDLLDRSNDAPVIKLINALFSQAINQQTSDIHIETYESQVLVRNRIDGVLHQVLEIQRAIAPLVVSRIKVMAQLDIAEKRTPQDGRIALRVGGHSIDVRVSTLPSSHGERIVLRILDKHSTQLNLHHLHLPDTILDLLIKMIRQPHGIILVTGPTGSGKTTSLYAMLTELNEVSRNILTIEDPIEYDLPGIGQTQVNPKIQMTFAKGLRAILRQDPDVVMIGEIRDKETADIAVQSSLTGHLVLSTLHTNTALGAITRLKDMGIESFLLSSSIVGLIAQRLVRKLCDKCKTPYHPNEDEVAFMQLNLTDKIPQIYAPHGCEACNQHGYSGRIGIYEVILMDEPLRQMIYRNDSLDKLEAYLRPEVASIRENGFTRVLAGQTSVTEILRVTSQ